MTSSLSSFLLSLAAGLFIVIVPISAALPRSVYPARSPYILIRQGRQVLIAPRLILRRAIRTIWLLVVVS